MMKNEEIRKVIGRRVRQYRTIHSLTQKQLASQIGAERPYISSIEQGQKGISFEKIYELCEFFNITVSDLLPIETKDDTEAKEKIVLETADMLRAMETTQVRMFSRMLAGVIDKH